MHSDAPFFVVGSDRSGTTLLRLMLDSHSRICIPRESWFLTDLMDALPLTGPLTEAQREDAIRLISGHVRFADWEVPPADLRRAVFEPQAETLAALIDAVFRRCGNPLQKPRWGDKTPRYIEQMERLAIVLPSAQFIHIVRDGRDVCLSLRAVRWQGDTTYEIARYWRRVILAEKRAERTIGAARCLEVRYEDLVIDPPATLTRICDFLGEGFEPAMLEFHRDAVRRIAAWEAGAHGKTNRPPQKSDAGRWRGELPRREVAMFEGVAADAMALVGQTLEYRGVRFLSAWTRASWAGLIEVSRPLRHRLGIRRRRLRA